MARKTRGWLAPLGGTLVWFAGIAGLSPPIPLRAQEEQRPNGVTRVRVPGTANPYLAGMADGTRSTHGDIAPRNSPIAIGIPPGSVAVSFTAEGRVAHGPANQHQHDGPEGSQVTQHETGAENGISDIEAPINSLVGVFLAEGGPDQTPPPAKLKLRHSGRDLVSVAPQLKQVFYIGTGKTRSGGGARRSFTVPRGATRLFLGVMDGYEWSNNDGEFQVTITVDRTDVSSTLTFADWACLPERSQCTPAEAMIAGLGEGRYRVVLPAHLEWGASVPARADAVVQILRARGTVCMEGACSGPEGNGSREDVLVKGRPAGALVTRHAGGRVFFSVNGRAGPAFGRQQGYFEFEVAFGSTPRD